jgi:hypothetical protein
MQILNTLKSKLDTDPNKPGLQVAWATIGAGLFRALIVPVASGLTAYLAFTLAGAFKLPPAFGLMTSATVLLAVWGHVAAAADAKHNVERIVNLAAFGVWLTLALMFATTAIGMSAAGIDGSTAGDFAATLAAWQRAGFAPELLVTGRTAYAYAFPAALLTGSLSALTRAARHVDGDTIKTAAPKVIMPAAFVLACVASLLHIYGLSRAIGYDDLSSFTVALLADLAFIAAELVMLIELGKRNTFIRRGMFDIAIWATVAAVSWGVMLAANYQSALHAVAASSGRAAGVGEIVIGIMPSIIAALLAGANVATALRDVGARAADEAVRLSRADIEADADHRRKLDTMRVRAELRKPTVSLNADGAQAGHVMPARIESDLATIASDLFPASSGYLRHSRKGVAGEAPVTESRRRCAQCGVEFVGTGRRTVCGAACAKARNSNRMRSARARL